MKSIKTIKKILITTALAFTLVFVGALPVSAASSGNWNINYIVAAPSSISDKSCIVYVDYYSGGYYADCTSISGANGRALTITSSSAGGMSTIPVTAEGRTRSWKMNSSASEPVRFKVEAVSGYSCYSTGTINIKN